MATPSLAPELRIQTNWQREAALGLLRRYGRIRTSLGHPGRRSRADMPRHTPRFAAWETRANFAIDIANVLDTIPPRLRTVLVEWCALDRHPRNIVRDLNITYRTLARRKAAGLDLFVDECGRRGLNLTHG